MAGSERDRRITTAIRRIMDPDEQVVGRGRCWVALRRPRVPLLFQGRRRHDAFLTDRRLVLVRRRRGDLSPSDVVLAKHFDRMVLDQEHQRGLLLQQRIRTDARQSLVLEWPWRERDLGWFVAEEVPRAPRPVAAPG